MGDPPRDFTILVHPLAGAGRAAERLSVLLRSPRPGALGRWDVTEVRSHDDIRAALDGAPDSVPVAAGGDGTLAMLARVLMERNAGPAIVGAIPLGTANLLAAEMGLRDAAAGLSALAHGVAVPVDVMKTDHPRAPVVLVSLSAGFEGRFIRRYGVLRRFGRLAGGVAGLSALVSRGRDIRLEVDGRDMVPRGRRVFAAGLYNTRCYAGGVVMNPGADPGDGIVEAAVYPSATCYLRSVVRGFSRGGGAGGDALRSSWSVARISGPGPFQADGEAIEGGTVTLERRTGDLRVLVPTPS